jgi:NitT/TauT family transport system ATP-binding protein
MTAPAESGNHGSGAEKLRVDRVFKTFPGTAGGRDTTALRDISLSVDAGEIVSVVGPSGCGKTTLLRIIDGLLEPDSGTIVVDGREVRGPGIDRAVVFQQPNLLPWRSALRNVELGLEFQRIRAPERTDRARRVLSLVGLDGFSSHLPHQLSGGMQQRIGLARALVMEPAILLMDEPFSALDAQTREELQGELLRLHESTNITVLLVTHDLDEAVYLSDRVFVLGRDPGRILSVIDVPMPRPRGDVVETRAEPSFLQARERVTELVKTR